MLIAICGTYDDTKNGSIRGNGKTMTAVYFGYEAYLNGQKVYTNFYTDFSEMITLNELLDLFKNDKLKDTLVILDEAQVYLMNLGVKAVVLKQIINLFIAQTRKRNVNVILTTQRYKNLHKQLRMQCDLVLLPIKYHVDDNGNIADICPKDNCNRQHVIMVFNTMTNEYLNLVLFPTKIGDMYNSDEIVLDEFKPEKPVKNP